MRAAWYEKQGPARDVLTVGEMPDPHPAVGDVRLLVAASGINPGDIKKRQDSFAYGMPYPRVIPHSDGAGQVDEIGEGVSSEWLGRSVWCYGAQSYRPFGTAAEFTVVSVDQVAPLPENVSMDQGACLGIPASPRTAPSMLRVLSRDVPCWCKAPQVPWAFALCD